MELRQYWWIVRRWWWLFAVCTVLGAVGAFVISSRMAPTYEASTLIMVGGGLDLVNPTTGELQTSEKLAQTYAELVKTRPVLEQTMAALNLPREPQVTVTLVRNTQLLRLTTADTDPGRARDTANELARQLILQSPSAPEREEQAYREFVQMQLTDLEIEIRNLSHAIVENRDAISSWELARLQQSLNEHRSNYSSLLGYLSSSATNYLQVIEPAVLPRSPSSPRILQNTVLAAIVGLMLAGGAAFLFEYLDDSIKTQGEVEDILGLPSLGTVFTMERKNGTAPGALALEQPQALEVENYRIIQMNLRYSLPAHMDAQVYLITSPGPTEGKSTTVANLSAVMAEAGQRVIVVDADLRRPSLHRVHDLRNEEGLSSLLVGEAQDVDKVLRPTAQENLRILTAGPIPPNPAVLLGSDRMRSLLEELSERCDVVIIDSPPLFAAADASILAGIATGTILVAEAGGTKAAVLLQAAEDLQRVGKLFLGVIVNLVGDPRKGAYGGYYGYQYYPRYAYGAEEKKRRLFERAS